MSKKNKSNKPNKIPSPRISESKLPIKIGEKEYLNDDLTVSLVFNGYFHNKCELSCLGKDEIQGLIVELNLLCNSKKYDIFTNKTCLRYSKIKKFERDNQYKRLFENISEQIQDDIIEFRYHKKRDSEYRFFGYFIKNIFVVILILKDHLNITR